MFYLKAAFLFNVNRSFTRSLIHIWKIRLEYNNSCYNYTQTSEAITLMYPNVPKIKNERKVAAWCSGYHVCVTLRSSWVRTPAEPWVICTSFLLYLNIINSTILCLNDICLILLLFADDMVILSLTPEDLQLSLNNLSEYCVKCGLEVNVAKTKIVVLRRAEY